MPVIPEDRKIGSECDHIFHGNYVVELPSVVVARVSLDFHHLRFRERWKPSKPRHIKEIHRPIADSSKVFGNLNT